MAILRLDRTNIVDINEIFIQMNNFYTNSIQIYIKLYLNINKLITLVVNYNLSLNYNLYEQKFYYMN